MTAWHRLSALSVVLAAVIAAPASAFEASVALNPSSIAYYGPADPRNTRAVEHRLTVAAGPQEERVIIEESIPGARDSGPSVEGDGTLTSVSVEQGIGDDFGSGGRDGCPARGFSFRRTRYQLTLPAGSTSTVVFTRGLFLTAAPLDASPFAASFTLAPAPAAGPTGVLEGASVVRSPPPALVGLGGSRLVLRAGPRGAGWDGAADARQRLQVKPRTPMTISGYLSPAHRGDRVTIWAYAPRATKPRTLAVVRVDHNGRFLHRRWRPAARGIWELYARWPGRSGLVEPARSGCGGPQIEVVSRVTEREPQPAPFGRSP